MFTISTLTMLVRLAPPSARGRVSSTYASAFLIGGMIGPVLGGVLAGWGLRVPFIVYGVALVIAAAVVAVGLRGARLRPVDDQGQREVMRLAEAWRSPVYRAVLASAAANGLTNFGVRLAVLPLLAVAVLDEAWVGRRRARGRCGGNRDHPAVLGKAHRPDRPATARHRWAGRHGSRHGVTRRGAEPEPVGRAGADRVVRPLAGLRRGARVW